jgi:hypothetical protein
MEDEAQQFVTGKDQEVVSTPQSLPAGAIHEHLRRHVEAYPPIFGRCCSARIVSSFGAQRML